MEYYKLKNFKFQVAKDSEIRLVNYQDIPDMEFEWFSKSGEILKVKKGYAWDGASGPVINTKNTIKASLVHDCLYQALRLGILSGLRKVADKELKDQMIKAGCWKIRATVWYWAVRIFGRKSAKPGNLQGKEKRITIYD